MILVPFCDPLLWLRRLIFKFQNIINRCTTQSLPVQCWRLKSTFLDVCERCVQSLLLKERADLKEYLNVFISFTILHHSLSLSLSFLFPWVFVLKLPPNGLCCMWWFINFFTWYNYYFSEICRFLFSCKHWRRGPVNCLFYQNRRSSGRNPGIWSRQRSLKSFR